MCQKISLLIRGKNKPDYKYNIEYKGDKCIVLNANNIFLTQDKALTHEVIYHTGKF